MEEKQAVVHICMISDDNYVMPTCVAIQSLIQAKKDTKYCIHIVASSLSQATESQFKKFETEDVKIDIVREDAEKRFANYHKFDKNAICVASISALLKFLLPELFPNIDKLLYLDGDLIAKIDVSEIYDLDVSEFYAAAVIDSGSMYYKHQYVQKVQHYFNSGVMLLNLKKLRDENMTEKLLDTKKNLNDTSLMDQNVFNLVFDRNIMLLPIRYNFMPVSLDRAYEKWSVKDVNEVYGTEYANKKEIFADAAIIHYSSKDKPWKALDGACASDWISCYLNAPIEHSLVNKRKRQGKIGISVIMPCFNVGEYVRQTLDSILGQTFQDFEILCLDDGSEDNTVEILKEYAAVHKNIRVFENSNHRQGYERNVGIRNAKGTYLYYMDSDDILDEKCFETIFYCAENNNLDLLYFEGTSFYDTKELEEKYTEYKTLYNRKDAFPKVYYGDELYVKFRKTGGLIISPCLQFVRREYIVNNYLYFPELPMMEDNLYTIRALVNANRVKCLTDILFYRRVRGGSTMTSSRAHERIQALSYTIRESIKDMLKYEKGSPMYLALDNHIRRFYVLYAKALEELKNAQIGCNSYKEGYEYVTEEEVKMALSSYVIDNIETQIKSMRDDLNEKNKKLSQREVELKKLREKVASLEKQLKKK